MKDQSIDRPSPIPGLGRTAKPFVSTDAAHAIVRAAEQVGWDVSDIDKFTRQVQHVEYGLSAEVEFAAILRWLGWCTFVHRLSDDVLEDPARNSWTVPDLFAVFQADGKTCTALVEVKTTKDAQLKIKTSYLQRLHSYAALLKQPLLIAWRPRVLGFWILFDPSIARPIDEESVVIDLELAIINDLMSILAGDYYLVPKDGAGIRFEVTRIGEKEATPDGYQALFQISDAYLHDAAGVRTEHVPDSVVWAVLSTVHDHQEISDEGFVQSFLASGGMTRAQVVLRTAVGYSLKEEERIHWKAVGNNLDAILKCDDLLCDAKAHFGSFMSYIFYQQPQKLPAFLPHGWSGRPARGPATQPAT
ncbi:hypothetical protein [Sinorhizobium sp. CCBAU 05631]|uniref:hypothetical protein n=1 Tax=Sinorhizobium sp. CCBAU 05631 TaxID=794846 RepID=UPI0005603FE4|nr:hypothetical protein [Sinorhizobium sp. CCBAU 05631]